MTSAVLTRDQAAEYIGVSVAKLDQLRAAGKLDPIQVDGSRRLVRYFRAELDAYLQDQPRQSETA